jgi:hypothetical protein
MERKIKRFVVTEKGQKTGVLLSLKEYESLIEDLHDLAIIAQRQVPHNYCTLPTPHQILHPDRYEEVIGTPR